MSEGSKFSWSNLWGLGKNSQPEVQYYTDKLIRQFSDHPDKREEVLKKFCEGCRDDLAWKKLIDKVVELYNNYERHERRDRQRKIESYPLLKEFLVNIRKWYPDFFKKSELITPLVELSPDIFHKERAYFISEVDEVFEAHFKTVQDKVRQNIASYDSNNLKNLGVKNSIVRIVSKAVYDSIIELDWAGKYASVEDLNILVQKYKIIILNFKNIQDNTYLDESNGVYFELGIREGLEDFFMDSSRTPLISTYSRRFGISDEYQTQFLFNRFNFMRFINFKNVEVETDYPIFKIQSESNHESVFLPDPASEEKGKNSTSFIANAYSEYYTRPSNIVILTVIIIATAGLSQYAGYKNEYDAWQTRKSRVISSIESGSVPEKFRNRQIDDVKKNGKRVLSSFFKETLANQHERLSSKLKDIFQKMPDKVFNLLGPNVVMLNEIQVKGDFLEVASSYCHMVRDGYQVNIGHDRLLIDLLIDEEVVLKSELLKISNIPYMIVLNFDDPKQILIQGIDFEVSGSELKSLQLEFYRSPPVGELYGKLQLFISNNDYLNLSKKYPQSK